jgi:hypothetical protein
VTVDLRRVGAEEPNIAFVERENERLAKVGISFDGTGVVELRNERLSSRRDVSDEVSGEAQDEYFILLVPTDNVV